MSSIAIFPCSHTPAENILDDLAQHLDLMILNDNQLISETAAAWKISEEKLNSTIYGKTSVFNQFTLEKEKHINALKHTLQKHLESKERYLFVGFLTSIIPTRIKHVLKVLAVDSKNDRVAYAVLQGMSKREAQKAVREFDLMAYRWTDFLFKKEAYEKSLYDVVVPVGNKTEGELLETITKFYHNTSVLRTEESQQAARIMSLETQVEHILLENGHKVDVLAEGSSVTITIDKSVLNFGKLQKELVSYASQVVDAEDIVVKRSADYSKSIYRRQKFELPSKVLFVDDEKEFTQTVSERLISRGVGTYGVFNGEQALEVVNEDKPDVMVLDLKMPGLHGIEVLRQTKEMAPGVEVIILTGHGTIDDMHQCMELGAFAYLDKPVDVEELSATIKAATEKSLSTIENVITTDIQPPLF